MQQSAPLIRISISGGLSNCDYLCHALADLSGLVVERYALREATARGVAFLAAGEPDDWQLLPVDRVFTPAANEPLLARYALLATRDGPARRVRGVESLRAQGGGR